MAREREREVQPDGGHGVYFTNDSKVRHFLPILYFLFSEFITVMGRPS